MVPTSTCSEPSRSAASSGGAAGAGAGRAAAKASAAVLLLLSLVLLLVLNRWSALQNTGHRPLGVFASSVSLCYVSLLDGLLLLLLSYYVLHPLRLVMPQSALADCTAL